MYIVSTVILLTSLIFSHEAPVNISKSSSQQCGFSNHAGMGSIYKNEFEAEIKLRKQCLRKPDQKELNKYCSTERMNQNASIFTSAKDLSYGSNYLYFKSYAADTLASEILLNGGQIHDLPKCIQKHMSKNPPHRNARKSILNTENLASASVLMEIYDGGFFSTEFEKYTNRLEASFPVLFKPRSRSTTLLSMIKDGLGSKFDFDNSDGRSHEDIMDAFRTLYSNDSKFKDKINNEIKNVKNSYKNQLKKNIEKVCNSTPMDIQKEYPAIFKQAILDMGHQQRLGANLYLCDQKEYYNPNEYDSDCDGKNDSEDIFPNDPFSPSPSQNHKGRSVQNPPFGSSYDYNVKMNKDVINLETNISFNLSTLSKDEQERFKVKVGQCTEDLTSSMDKSFMDLKRTNANFSGKLKSKIKLSYGNSSSSSFSVAKCYCSDCKDRVIDPEKTSFIFNSYIDHKTCWDDLTEKQQQAVKKVFPNAKKRWRNRENAANLTTEVDCNTIKHELLHRFGLPDEYSDRNSYPYNRVACNIMGDAYNSETKNLIEGRHIEAIILPESCE